MINLSKLIKSYDDSGVRLVSDFRTHIVAAEILKTFKTLQEWNLGSWEILDLMVADRFKLDIRNNEFHVILWENWMRFMCDIGFIAIETRWTYPFALHFTQDDINYFDNIVKNEID